MVIYKKINSQVAKLFYSFKNLQWQRQRPPRKGIDTKTKPHVYWTIYFLECIFCAYLKFSIIKKILDNLSKLALKALQSLPILLAILVMFCLDVAIDYVQWITCAMTRVTIKKKELLRIVNSEV